MSRIGRPSPVADVGTRISSYTMYQANHRNWFIIIAIFQINPSEINIGGATAHKEQAKWISLTH